MTNTATETKTVQQIAEATPYLFLEADWSDNPNREIIVAKKDWFEDVPSCEIRNSYGIIEDDCQTKDENGGECCCETVRAYEFWDGSNHKHIVISAPWDVHYSIIDDENDIAELSDVVVKAKTDNNYPFEDGSTGYKSCEVGDYRVTESIWTDAWELYTITLLEDED